MFALRERTRQLSFHSKLDLQPQQEQPGPFALIFIGQLTYSVHFTAFSEQSFLQYIESSVLNNSVVPPLSGKPQCLQLNGRDFSPKQSHCCVSIGPLCERQAPYTEVGNFPEACYTRSETITTSNCNSIVSGVCKREIQ